MHIESLTTLGKTLPTVTPKNVPPAKKNSSILKVVVISVILSCAFKWLPLLNNVSSGFVIIICTIIAASIGAIFFPIKEEKE